MILTDTYKVTYVTYRRVTNRPTPLFLSQGTTLQAGSLIATGTPGGVGVAMKPPVFLKDGDEVAVEIEGIEKLVSKIRFE